MFSSHYTTLLFFFTLPKSLPQSFLLKSSLNSLNQLDLNLFPTSAYLNCSNPIIFLTFSYPLSIPNHAPPSSLNFLLHTSLIYMQMRSHSPSMDTSRKETPLETDQDPETLELVNDMQQGISNILVAVRCRPLTKKRRELDDYKTVHILDEKLIIVIDPSAKASNRIK